jgi:hypothetical protein
MLVVVHSSLVAATSSTQFLVSALVKLSAMPPPEYR